MDVRSAAVGEMEEDKMRKSKKERKKRRSSTELGKAEKQKIAEEESNIERDKGIRSNIEEDFQNQEAGSTYSNGDARMKKQKRKKKRNSKDMETKEKNEHVDVLPLEENSLPTVGSIQSIGGDGDPRQKQKKKRKRKDMEAKENNEHVHPLLEANIILNDGSIQSADHDGDAKAKRRKREKKRKRMDLEAKEKNGHADAPLEGDSLPDVGGRVPSDHDGEANKDTKRKKRHKSRDEIEHQGCRKDKNLNGEVFDDDTKTVEDIRNTTTTPDKRKRKVKFSDEVEVCLIPNDSNSEAVEIGDGLVRGKRFTREEDEIVKKAVADYIEERGLGENGLEMVLNSRQHPEARGCWREIGSAIPYRPSSSIYYRAQILFRRSDTRKWTEEEYELILNHQKEHGNVWKDLAEELGRHRFHIKDTWRRKKLENVKKGSWSQDEYQKLFDLVNTDLQKRVHEERKSKHGMLRDNICWTAISDVLLTRAQANCCLKWYGQLTSPLVAQGLWEDSDDYRLLTVLYELDAACMEDVDWDNLLDHRSGDLCRKRWSEMVRHIGHHGSKAFADQVEIMAQRYCPYLLEAREIWESKPIVP